MSKRRLLVAALAVAGWCEVTHAQLRCDCTTIVDTCSADVAVKGSFIEIKSDTQQCSRVDYFVDGLPFVSVVVNGEDRQNWIPRTGNPKVLVQSCQVCRDSGTGQAAPHLDQKPLFASQCPDPIIDHKNIRGAKYYH